MKNNSSLFYGIALVVGDFLALIAAFSAAYVLRVKWDERPLLEQIPAETYLYAFVTVLPLWILMHAFIGLYSAHIYQNRFSEFGRIIIGSFLGILVVIGYDFVIDDTIFPARLVVVYGFLLSFLFLAIFRTLARSFRNALYSYGVGLENILLVGNGKVTKSIIGQIIDSKHSGYKILGVVGGSNYDRVKTYTSFSKAVVSIKSKNIHSIIQTELGNDEENEEIFSYAQANHIGYSFVPGNSELLVGNIQVELFRETPVVTVHQTALVGWGRFAKRIFDLLLGSILLILASPILILVALMMKLRSPREPVLFRQQRLTQFDQPFTVFKFRSQYKKFDGTTPEEAFSLIGQPDLIEKYRGGGDKLDADPRITPLGRWLRATSLDELPQLINVVLGDISLVGPRALIPEELKDYHHRHHILSVKSGLTGLAQVSGRRDISFEERRKLDVYYVQNWSFWLDLSILIKTIRAVLSGVGAK